MVAANIKFKVMAAVITTPSEGLPFTYYSAPNRIWQYDERFNDPDQLPPLTPIFVYLRQELFLRDYTDAGG